MTPKEKALELIQKMYATGSKDSSEVYREAASKRCALIVVDEIIDLLEDAADVFENECELSLNETAWNYWLKVKSEL